ncbi:MAG TPA: peptidylprolyl isomerase [Nanoarchaeota archaeon]|nr:peptidylprolyl isomerase [Candidatus Woesearchaeota archaeon]HIH15147.1 peptidylprolyl isomerase [Nanoarchaeota archaeon]HIH59413.1 peptidylprolyl isomerase [Nanoarchaeota archaeon]HII14318.1 peptidylprolyl isomerase [Nanoarchaeota archaeon]HIJ04595.1 peptidylprolyl isomerase [Nanoarchaeota archaeon]
MKAQKGDFVQIMYIGKLDDGSIFDLNDKERAKKEGMNGHIHEKTIVCLGEKDLVPGLDDFLIEKEIGEKLEVIIEPEKGFGKKDPKLLQIVPANKFKEQKINPMPGLRVEIDQYTGVIKSISGGRVLVDFNHPLAGRTLQYEIMIVKKIESLKEKVAGFLELNFHLHNAQVEEKEGTITLTAPIPKEMQPMLETELKRRIPEIKALLIEQSKK